MMVPIRVLVVMGIVLPLQVSIMCLCLGVYKSCLINPHIGLVDVRS